MNLNEARDILGKCGYSFLKESTELTRDVMLKYAKQLAQQNDKIGIIKGKNPEDGDFDIIIYYNDDKIKVASYKGYENEVYVREFKSSLSGMPIKKVETLEDLRSYIDSTLKYMEKYKEDNNNQYKTSVEDIEKDKEEWANNMDQNESLKLKKTLQFLAECGYTVRKKQNLNEMSRASNRVLGPESLENLLYMLTDWKKGYDRQGKKPTGMQIKKFVEENGFSWRAFCDVTELPENIGSSRTKYGFATFLPNIEARVGKTKEELDAKVNAGKDIYDNLIDLFWKYRELVHDDAVTPEFTNSPEFKKLVSLFKHNPEKAEEVFGRNFPKAMQYLAKFVDPDYEYSPRGLIAAFWDWYREKKAGNDIDFDPEKAEKLAEVLEGPNPESYFSNKGLFYFVKRTVGNMIGRTLGSAPVDDSEEYEDLVL